MGQKSSSQSKCTAASSASADDSVSEFPQSSIILPGAYAIRNKASGTVLHVLTQPEHEGRGYNDIVGWAQEISSIETMENQIWWVEWDAIHKAYTIANIGKGVVLDVTGSFRSGPVGKGSTDDRIGRAVCARPRVKGVISPCTSQVSTRSVSPMYLMGKSGNSSHSTIISRASSLEVEASEDVLNKAEGTSQGLELGDKKIEERVKGQRWVLKRVHPSS